MRLPLFVLGLILAVSRPAAAAELSGTVLETMNAGEYTYIRLGTAAGEKWVAIPKVKLAKGSKAAVSGSVEMKNFQSTALKRTFPSVLFGALNVADAAAMSAMAGHGAKAAAPDLGPISVDKAAGPDGRTVAELYAQKAALKGKSVLIRGKVVKVTPAVMDLNWVHLRDGSGSAKTGDNDLTLTTTETFAVGKVVAIRGTITLDKDLGGRYQFPVLLEGAELVP